MAIQNSTHLPDFARANYLRCFEILRIIFISKSNGSIDVWDFTDTCYNPLKTISLTPNYIKSMELLDKKLMNNNANPFQQLLAIGDNTGSLHLFELPRKFLKPHPKEADIMSEFLLRQRKTLSGQ